IDPAEPLDRAGDDPVGDRRVGDVAGHGEYVRRVVCLDGPGVRNDPEAAVEEPTDQARADPLRRTGYDTTLRSLLITSPLIADDSRDPNYWPSGCPGDALPIASTPNRRISRLIRPVR